MKFLTFEDQAGVEWVLLLGDDGEVVEKITKVEFDSIEQKSLLF